MLKKVKKIVSLVLVLAMSFAICVPAFAENNNKERTNKIYKGVVSYVNEVYPNLAQSEKSKLITKLFKEKNVESAKLQTKSKKSSNKIDEDYQNVMKEEHYIVNLIKSCGTDTTQDNWQFNLNYLKDNYNKINKISNVEMTYVNSYISAYEAVLATQDMPDEKVNTCKTILSNNSYNFNDAVDYAEEHYDNYNDSVYPDWSSYGGDCANFISQCLHEGGKTMRGRPGSTSAADNTSNWFSKGTAHNTKNVSRTWRGASYFRTYWQNHASSYKKFTSVNSSSFDYGFMGDAISLLTNTGRAYHTLIIVGYSYPDFRIATHTYDTDSANVNDYSASGFIIYNMR